MLLYPFLDGSLTLNYHLMANYRKSIMATFKFYIPAINLMGAGCLQTVRGFVWQEGRHPHEVSFRPVGPGTEEECVVAINILSKAKKHSSQTVRGCRSKRRVGIHRKAMP